MSDALSRMVGGSHYLKNGIQPVEFVMKNRWDFCLGSSLKYLTRWRDKAGVQDLQKSKHFIELREATMPKQPWPNVITYDISMQYYIAVNGLDGLPEASALLALESYAYLPSPENRNTLFRLIEITAESA